MGETIWYIGDILWGTSCGISDTILMGENQVGCSGIIDIPSGELT